MSDDLDPLIPGEAREMYLDHRRSELSESTCSAHHYRLKQFCEWCDEQGITNLNDLSGRDLHRYRVYRLEELDLTLSTVRGDLFTLKAFLEFCEAIDAVEEGLHAKVAIPTVTKGNKASDEALGADHAEAVLEYLERYDYASNLHAAFLLAWHTGVRLGGLRALDLDDYHPDADPPHVEVRHRPETDTPLKNAESGERPINISEEVVDVLNDYIDVKREDTTDEHGREPLFTTSQGRASSTVIRNWFYRISQPCNWGECPHDRDPSECEARQVQAKGSLCPSSYAPHAVRTGSITHQRNMGIPAEIVSERVNATEEIIELHYDKRTEHERMQQRRENLEVIL